MKLTPIKNQKDYYFDENMQIISKKQNRLRVRVLGISPNGYYYLTLWSNNKGRTHMYHKLVAQTFIPNIHDKPFINHKDGNKLNNSIDNLEWCTSSENNQHAYDSGLKDGMKGIKHPNCKLTEDEVLMIVKRFNDDESTRSISKDYNITMATIRDINKGKSWSHLTGINRGGSE